jgi:hypothetical protein
MKRRRRVVGYVVLTGGGYPVYADATMAVLLFRTAPAAQEWIDTHKARNPYIVQVVAP